MLSNLNKDNLHHAYLLLGGRDAVLPQVLEFVNSLGVQIQGNPDFIKLEYDTFKIDDARNLKSRASEKQFGGAEGDKKVFIISANQFLLEAQNTLLKVFEEPSEHTHFFIISPNVQNFLPTLLSRFYVLDLNTERDPVSAEAINFLKMNLNKRVGYIKDLLAGVDEDEDGTSPRTVALEFLNSVESVLHQHLVSKTVFDTEVFEHIFNVRENLRQPGSAPKMLLESVALAVPEDVLK